MDTAIEFEELNPYGLYRTPLQQAMQRPYYEPPDIDITGIFETKDHADFLEHIKEVIPDPVLRCDFLDLWSENHALGEYLTWVFDCGRAAICCGDEEREAFYENLINVILVDSFLVWDGFSDVFQEISGEKPGRHPYEANRNKPFSFRDETGLPIKFRSRNPRQSKPQPSAPPPSAEQIDSTNNQAEHPNDHQSSLPSTNQFPSNMDTNNNERTVSETPIAPAQSKSSKNCCAIL